MPSGSSGFERVQAAQLALFLILLAFFMALVAPLDFEDRRVGNVLTTVRETFSEGAGDGFLARRTATQGESWSLDAARRLSAGLRRIFPEANLPDGVAASGLSLELPLKGIFAADGSVRAERLARTAEALTSVPLSALRVRLLLPADTEPRRVAEAGRLLYEPALIGADVAAGIDNGLRGKARLSIELAPLTGAGRAP